MSGPIFLLQILPAFVENISPELSTASPAEIEAFVFRYYGAATLYLVIALFVVRRWAARLYTRAALLHRSNELQFIRQVTEQLEQLAADRAALDISSAVGHAISQSFGATPVLHW